MFTLRPTKKLHERLGIRALSAEHADAPPTTRLGDWYANVYVHHRKQVVLFLSDRTLLPIVVAAAPFATLPARFRPALGEVLAALGVPEAHVRSELAEMADHAVGKTANRRVLGTLKELAWQLEGAPPLQSFLTSALWLAETPCSAIGWKAPRDATMGLFQAGGEIGLAD